MAANKPSKKLQGFMLF